VQRHVLKFVTAVVFVLYTCKLKISILAPKFPQNGGFTLKIFVL